MGERKQRVESELMDRGCEVMGKNFFSAVSRLNKGGGKVPGESTGFSTTMKKKGGRVGGSISWQRGRSNPMEGGDSHSESAGWVRINFGSLFFLTNQC